MTSEKAREWLLTHSDWRVSFTDGKGAVAQMPLAEAVELLRALMFRPKVCCDTCRHYQTGGIPCRECDHFSWWEEADEAAI